MNENTEKLEKIQKKQLFHARLQSLCLIIMAVCAVLACLKVNSVLVNLDTQINNLQKTLEAIDTQELNQAVISLHEAADRLASVDMDTLNKTVASLNDAAENLGRVDMDAVNEAMNSANKVVKSLEEMVDKLTKSASLFSMFK